MPLEFYLFLALTTLYEDLGLGRLSDACTLGDAQICNLRGIQSDTVLEVVDVLVQRQTLSFVVRAEGERHGEVHLAVTHLELEQDTHLDLERL